MCLSVAAAAIVMTALGFLIKAVWGLVSLIPAYIIGGIIGAVLCILLRKILFAKDNYFYPGDINDMAANLKKRKLFWIQRIRENKFVRQGEAWATYIPCLVLGIGLIVFAILIYPTLLSGYESTEDYVGYAILSSIIGGAACSWITYGIMGMLSFKACKKCGAVNAFVYDEFLDYNEASGFTGNGMSYSFSRSRGGISYGGGGYNTSKISNSGIRVSCHCACCGEKSVVTEAVDESQILKQQEAK